MSVTDTWPPKRPGPASDRDNVTRQTLQAGIRAPPPEKPYVSNIIHLRRGYDAYAVRYAVQKGRSGAYSLADSVMKSKSKSSNASGL